MQHLRVCRSSGFLSSWFSLWTFQLPGTLFRKHSKQSRRCALPEAFENTITRALESALVLKQVVVPVCAVYQRVQFKCKLRGVDSAIKLAKGLGISGFGIERVEPGPRKVAYEIPDRTRSAVELDGAGHEKAPPAKDAASDVGQPFVEHRQQPDEPALASEGRVDYFEYKDI